VDADAQLNSDVTATPRHRDVIHRRPDVDRHVGDLGHVTVAITLRHTADNQVDAPDGFHLQQGVLIEATKLPVTGARSAGPRARIHLLFT